MWALFKRKTICFFAFLFLFNYTFSQDSLKYHSFGFAGGFIRSYEGMVSPLAFKGAFLLQNYRYEKIQPRFIKYFDFNIALGGSLNANNFYFLHLINMLDFSYLRNISSSASQKIYAGVSFSSNINARYHLNFGAPYGEHFVSLAPVLHYEKQTDFLKKHWHFWNRVRWGLLNEVLRPGYGYSPPEPFTEQNPKKAKAWIQSYQMLPFWKFFFFSNEFCLIKNYPNGNRKSISYIFSINATGYPEKAVQAIHGIKITYQWLKK
jgi:hypothetical protein